MRYPTKSVGSSSLVSGLSVSTNPCKLIGAVGYSDGTAPYLLVFELGGSPALPANGTVAKFTIVMDAARNWAFQLPDALDMDACCFAPSSTADTLTIVAGNHQSILAIIAG